MDFSSDCMLLIFPSVEYSRSLAEACSDGDVTAVRKLLDEGRSVHETTEEGESLLCLACSAGYYELAQVSSSQAHQQLRFPDALFAYHFNTDPGKVCL